MAIDRWLGMNRTRWMAGWFAASLLWGLGGCSRLKPQAPSTYAVDTQTVWHTIALTPEGVHYGVDLDGMSSNGPIRTVWLQKRSANSPYLYDKWQINVHCADGQLMWLLRTVVENNHIKAIEHDVTFGWDGELLKKPKVQPWSPVATGSKDDMVLKKVCAYKR